MGCNDCAPSVAEVEDDLEQIALDEAKTIAKKAATITVADKSKVYGTSDPEFTSTTVMGAIGQVAGNIGTAVNAENGNITATNTVNAP